MKLKKTILSVVACVLSFVMVFAFAACGTDKEPEVTAISLSQTTANIATGESTRLTITATYSDSTSKELEAKEAEWSSSAENVAAVTRGVVSAKSKGTATITAKVGELTATCAVTVFSLVVELSDTTATVEKGQTKALTATVKKDGVAQDSEKVEWSSSDDTIATVDANGVVTAFMEGSATITAKRKDGAQKADCEVTVVWANKPASYKAIGNTEQNKAKPNTWGYWNDQGWNWSTSKMYEAYSEDYTEANPAAGFEHIGVNKATFDFEIATPGTPAIIQAIYRSAGEEGKLETNRNYEISLKLHSNVAGTVTLNAYGDVEAKREKGENESEEEYNRYLEEYEEMTKEFENEFEIVAGENTLKATFRHGDFGSIYKNGVYDNVEAAIHLLLGALEGRVVVSVYDVQFKALEEATHKVTEDSSKLEGAEEPAVIPDLSGVEAIALELASNNDEMYAVTTQDEGKSYNVVYTNTVGESYANLVVDLSEANAAECNTFAVTVKNNDTNDMRIRFDINGQTAHGANNVFDIVKSAVATSGNPTTNLEWGGTDLNVAAGATVTLYLTFDPATESGTPKELLIYFHTHVYQDGGNTHSGNVTLSDFKFASVETVNNNMAFGQEKDDEWGNKGIEVDGKYYYWNDQNWAGATVTMSQYTYEDGVITLGYKCTAGGTDFAVQIFSKSDQLTAGSEYTLTFKINVAVATKITINGTEKELTAGDNDISVTFTAANCTQAGEGLTFSMQIHASTEDGTATNKVVVSNIVYTPVAAA